MRAKEFLDDYAVDDLNVFGRHEEHYSLDNLMEEYARIYHENEVKKLRLSAVSGQSELLIAFADWVFNQPKHLGGRERELVAEYLKAINSH